MHRRAVALMPARDLLVARRPRVDDPAVLPAEQLDMMGHDDRFASRALQGLRVGAQQLRKSLVAEDEASILGDEDAGVDGIDERAVASLAGAQRLFRLDAGGDIADHPAVAEE